MQSALEIPAAEVETNGHVCWAVFEYLVVSSNIGVEDCGMVDALLFHALKHGLGAEVGEQRVVELNISTTTGVEVLEFFLVRDCDIGKVLIIVLIDTFVEGVLSVAEVVPFWSTDGKLEVLVLLGFGELLQILELFAIK